MPLAVFRADASASIGAGHVARSASLAGALEALGWRCGFASAPGAARVFPPLAQFDPGSTVLDGPAGTEPAALREAYAAGCDLLVVDHYERGARFESDCRGWARRILVIDDLADKAHDCDWLLNQNPGWNAAHYANLVPAGARVLLGAGYALLRPEFARARERALGGRRGGEGGRRVAMSIGATDAGNVTGRLLDAFARSRVAATVDVILSSAAPHLAAVRRAAAACSPPAAVHVDAGDVADRLAGADLAIGAGGTSAWERCCLGLPTVLVVTAANQSGSAEALAAAGAAVLAGDSEGLDGAAVADLAGALLDDPARLGRMSGAAAAMCDGAGAPRLAAMLSGAIGA